METLRSFAELSKVVEWSQFAVSVAVSVETNINEESTPLVISVSAQTAAAERRSNASVPMGKKWHAFEIGGVKVRDLTYAVACAVDSSLVLGELCCLFSNPSRCLEQGGWMYLSEATMDGAGAAFTIPWGLPDDVRMGISLRLNLISSGRSIFRLGRKSEGRPFKIEPAGDGRGYVNNLRIFPDAEIPGKEFEPIYILNLFSHDFYCLYVQRERREVRVKLVLLREKPC